MIEYVLIVLVSLLMFLCLSDFIEQLAGSNARRAPASFSRTRQPSRLKGEPK